MRHGRPGLVVRNALLLRLPPTLLAALMPKLAAVPLVRRQILHDADDVVDTAYFPQSGLLSLVTELADGTQMEVGVVGREGMVGPSLTGSAGITPVRCVVQLPGVALKVTALAFRHAVDAAPELREAMYRHTEAMLAQAVQSVPCTARHNLRQRLARWLLMAHDRMEDDEMPLTQEFLAAMLATHRPSITVAVAALQRMGAIRSRRGWVTVQDRAMLEACSCECYAAVRRRVDNLLGSGPIKCQGIAGPGRIDGSNRIRALQRADRSVTP